MSKSTIPFVPLYGSEQKKPEDLAEVKDFPPLKEVPAEKRGQPKRFMFDNEESRNFDKTNIQKAEQGVKEIVRDAINKAKTQAVNIKQAAQKEGYDAGYREGFQKGEQEAKVDFEPFLATLQSVIHEMSLLRKHLYSKVEREMVEMVLELAKKVILHEMTANEYAVQDMIRLAVESVLHKESMTIRIHPSDKTHAESYRPELHHMFGEIKNITLEADSSIQRGGCIIETNFGSVDARIEKLNEQIDKILNLAPPLREELETEAPVSEEPGPEEHEPEVPDHEEQGPTEKDPDNPE